VLFVQAAAEDLPTELNCIADEVHVHFPWGSLLKAVAAGDESLLSGLRRICSPDAVLEVIIGLDPERDRAEIQRLGLEPLTTQFMKTELASRYRAAGFEIIETGVLLPSDRTRLRSSWAKRLQRSKGREVVYIIARAPRSGESPE